MLLFLVDFLYFIDGLLDKILWFEMELVGLKFVGWLDRFVDEVLLREFWLGLDYFCWELKLLFIFLDWLNCVFFVEWFGEFNF